MDKITGIKNTKEEQRLPFALPPEVHERAAYTTKKIDS